MTMLPCGHDLADRGRIPASVIEVFEAAQSWWRPPSVDEAGEHAL